MATRESPATAVGEPASHSLQATPAVEKVRELLGHFRSAMLVTLGQGMSHCRPMGLTGSAQAFDGTLWFFAADATGKVREIEGGALTTLIFQSDEAHAYLQLQGHAHVDDDDARKQQLYTPLIRTWFPRGLDDPNLILIRFDAEAGRYWDSPGGMLRVLASFTKALLTGRPAAGGETGSVELR